MVQVSFPGVYIREVPSGVRTITGVATSIAAFVGMAKGGPMFKPTTVLGFADYTRIFSADASLGEMTDQVRQFFLNGGQQAVITRVASGATASTIELVNRSAPAATLTLEAKNIGKVGEVLRTRVDYNASSPERTFNLTIYEELLDENGVGSAGVSEMHRDLSLHAADPRFIGGVLEEDSELASLTGTTVNALGDLTDTEAAFSVGAALAVGDGGVFEAGPLATALALAGGTGKFRLKVGADPWVVVTVTTPTLAGINTALGLVTTKATAQFVTLEGLTGLRILATQAGSAHVAHGDVLIDRGPDQDIAVALGLGTAQGGIEVGAFGRRRPVPNGFVSEILDATATGNPADLTPLFQLAAMARTEFSNGFGLTGPQGFTVDGANVTFPGSGGSLSEGTTAGRSLLNVAENLEALASAINLSTDDWQAEVHGYRLALVPTFGNASSGTAHTWNGATVPANFFGAGATARIFAQPFGGALDGGLPTGTSYTDAYDVIDANVDLFNILVLPRNAGEDPDLRASRWGAASSFCQRRRAFLLIDAKPPPPTGSPIDEILEQLDELRLGIVQDHAGLYWPQVRVNPGGVSRFIDPSGSIAGIMARTDSTRGVWKAPAGLEADVRGVLGVKVPMSDPENGRLNPQAINAIRVFPNGVITWGARTVAGFDNSGNIDYKYVPVRRFALFIEESLYRGLKFAVFEPNDEPLWAQLRLAVGAFLNNLFRQGAFAGRTTRDSYFVKVDAETTTQDDINRGIVNVVVGFAPLKPAEFVVITIQQKAGQIPV